jgi:hypothetical protein
MLKTKIEANEILSLEETDRVFADHRHQSMRSNKEPGFAFKRTSAYEPTLVWLAVCRCLAEKLRDEPAVLLVGPYEFCGGLSVSVDLALSAVVPLLEFDQNTVRLQSRSSESGLFLDMFEENSKLLVDLVVWGKWKIAAESCA